MSVEIARACTRLLELRPGRAVFLSVEDGELEGALTSLLESAGAVVAKAAAEAEAAVVDVDEPWEGLVPVRVRAPAEQLPPGSELVLVCHAGTGERSHARFGATYGPCVALGAPEVETVGRTAIMHGSRRAEPGNAERKRLRGIGHGIDPSVLIGRSGLTGALIAAAREAVERHGLIKAKLTPQSDLDKNEAATELAWATGSVLVQRVGKTALLYRPDVALQPPTSGKSRGRRR